MIVLYSQSVYFTIAALEVVQKILPICSLYTVFPNVEIIQKEPEAIW